MHQRKLLEAEEEDGRLSSLALRRVRMYMEGCNEDSSSLRMASENRCRHCVAGLRVRGTGAGYSI